MIGFLSVSHNHPQDPNRIQHQHQRGNRRRRRDPDYQYFQVKLVGSLTTVMILLLGTTTTITTGLPTPPSVHSRNNQQQSYDCDNRDYFVNDQVQADRWTHLCGWTNRSNTYRTSLPVGVGTGSDRDDRADAISSSSEERQLLVEVLQRFLRDTIAANDDGSSTNFASVTYEEEPIQIQAPPPPPPEKLAPNPKRHSNAKLNNFLLNDQRESNHRVKEHDEILENDNSHLPFFDNDDDDIQRQVIFIQIPETMLNLHVHRPPPQTIVYVLPPKEESHMYRIFDTRSSQPPFGGGGQTKVAPPSVHFLTNFGGNKIDTESLTTGRPPKNHANLHGQSQSKPKSNRNDQKVFLPIKGVPPPPPIPAAADRFNQHPHLSGQITTNSNRANKDFEIVPAFNGYFFI